MILAADVSNGDIIAIVSIAITGLLTGIGLALVVVQLIGSRRRSAELDARRESERLELERRRDHDRAEREHDVLEERVVEIGRILERVSVRLDAGDQFLSSLLTRLTTLEGLVNGVMLRLIADPSQPVTKAL